MGHAERELPARPTETARVDWGREVFLSITATSRPSGPYPSSRIPKGPVLVHRGVDLSEEGVGFGVPVLKQGLKTVFPGSVRLSVRAEGRQTIIDAAFEMNLHERLTRSSGSEPGGRGERSLGRILGALQRTLAAAFRRAPALRGALTRISGLVRTRLGVATVFEEAPTRGSVRVRYVADPEAGELVISADTRGLDRRSATELVLMNEMGANHFDAFRDSSGLRLRGSSIGAWERVQAGSASFVDSRSGITFSMDQVPGARMFRGTELIGSRLAWSGLAYSISPRTDWFSYTVTISVE